MTGNGVSGSNSVEFAPSMPTTWRANSATAICMPRQMPRNGIFCSRAIRAAAILPSIPRSPKPPGIRMPSTPCSARARSSSLSVSESTHSISNAAAVLEARVAQRLDDGQVRVLELDVLADQRDLDRAALWASPARRTSCSQSPSSGAGASIPKWSRMKSSTPSAR